MGAGQSGNARAPAWDPDAEVRRCIWTSRVMPATLRGDCNRVVAEFRNSAQDHLSGPAPARMGALLPPER